MSADVFISYAAKDRERILVIDDVRTNSLIIVAKEDNFEELAQLAQANALPQNVLRLLGSQ